MTDPADHDDAAAGELALRVLSPDEEAAVRARAEADPSFASQVDVWNDRLAGFADVIAPVAPSSGLWPRIERALGRPAANDNGPVIFWRRWAMGSTALLAASLAAVVMLATRDVSAPVPPASGPQVVRVATLTLQQGGEAAMTLVYDPNTENLYLSPTEAMGGDTRVPHLWLVAPEGGVQLVGAIDGSQASRHHLAAVLTAPAGRAEAVAVSMEAPGHTPAADRPDGPVVASGTLERL